MDLGGGYEPRLESYEAAFRDNEINDGVLPSLTTEALSDDLARCPR